MLYIVFVPYKLTDLYLNHLLVILLTVIIILGLKKRSPLDNLFGELTYSTYLLHIPVLSAAAILGLKYPTESIAALILTYVLSLFVVKFIEAPLDKGRKILTARLLETADELPVKSSSASMYITAAFFVFLLVSAGYNIYRFGSIGLVSP
jgi:peptidoglycan/LPS O-acetylase OafA/YrhL